MQHAAFLLLEPDQPLVAMIRHYKNYELGNKGEHLPASNLRQKKLERIKAYIKDHLHETISPAALASMAGLSVSHLRKLFKASVGMTLHRYIIYQRIKKAGKLLASTDMLITDIAFEVGYQEVSNFIKAFRKEMGVTPKRYRAMK